MFDPYHKWLGIPPKDQPPNYYRLLAIDLFESDPEVIDAAANRQMAYVQQRATGEHIAQSQKLLNELAAARLCLLDQKKKATYDLQLKVNLRQQARRTGGGPEKPPKITQSAGFKAKAHLTDRAQPPPVIGTPAPSAEDAPAEDAPFSQSLRRMRVIIFALGGVLFLVMVLIIVMYIISGREKGPDTVADTAESGGQNGSAEGKNTDANNKTEKPSKTTRVAIYNVEINPPSATLTIQQNTGTITGSGRARIIRFDSIPWRGQVLVTASCDGYKPYNQWLTPKLGQDEKLSIELRKDTPEAPPLASSRINTPKSATNVTGNIPSGGTNNPPIKINRPIDVRSEHVPSSVETPNTERRKVFVFAGESAIVTPVLRSLPSTVEAWIWCAAPAENADMYVFGSDNTKQSTGGLGVRIGKNGQLGGRRTQTNKKLRDFWTGEFLPIQKWTHLAVTFDEDKICFYVDGHLIHTDKGAQDTDHAPFVVGYIGYGPYKIPKYTFVGKIRTVRISSGIRYNGEFRPQFDFIKNQVEDGFKTSLIYDASNAKGDTIPDLSGNKKDGKGLNVTIVGEDIPLQ